MLIAAMVFGIVGAAIGIAGAIVVMLAAIGVSSTYATWMSAVAIFFSVVGGVGGALASRMPRAAGLLMISGATGGFVAIFIFFAPAFILMIVGGVYALIASCDVPQRRT